MTMLKTENLLFSLVVLAMLASGCQQSEYERMVSRELAGGERHDSLFLGLYLGMAEDSFYLHCRELNRRQLIMEGAGGLSVEYDINELDDPVQMNFYPNFYKGEIYRIGASFTYEAWAPWNRELWADSLLTRMVGLLEGWYGDGFIRMEHPEDETVKVYVKVDGNRRIRVWQKDDRYVQADFTDLPVDREVREKAAESAGKEPERMN